MLFGQPVNVPEELTPEELEARAQAFHEGLERQGMVLHGTQVLPKDALKPYIRDETHPVEAWDQPPHRTSIFLNFFGGPLKNGTNASESESPCVQGNIDYPGYLAGEQAALAIIQVFKDAAEPFGMRILYEKVPPKHLPYSQVMMGGRPGVIGLPQGVLGVACNLDCGDSWWRDTTFAFTEETNQVSILGTTALQEAAHAWGLDHIDGANNIMYPYATPGDKVWASTCTPYNDATGGIGCQPTHDKFCDGGAQNDVAELMAYFGPNSVDSEAPTVKMLSPTDGQMYTKGDTLHIEASGWRVGGGCVAPLAFEGETARLTTTAFCVIADPTEPLFLLGALGRTPNANDRIEVRKATFKVEARDQLRAAVEYRTGADLSDPLSGAVISFETTDGGLLERTR